MPFIPKISSGTTIFSVMSALAARNNAINLSQGFPDYPVDPLLADYLHEAVMKGYNQYTLMSGLPELRTVIANKLQHFTGVQQDPDTEITVTPGGTYAIYAAIAALVRPGDEVIILEPAYDCYSPAVLLNGGHPVYVPLDAARNYTLDRQQLKDALTAKTRLIIINTPHNPTGSRWNRQDFEDFAAIIQHYDLAVISDEVYEHIIFDHQPHISILQFPELRSRAVAIYSFGKVLNATGWKTGYAVAPPPITGLIRQVHQFLAFTANTPAQYAIARYLQDYSHITASTQLLQNKRDYFIRLMEDTRFTLETPASGSYFQVYSYKEISTLPEAEFAVWLTEQYGVATIPVSAFYHNNRNNHTIRFCFAKKDTTLQAAVALLIAV